MVRNSVQLMSKTLLTGNSTPLDYVEFKEIKAHNKGRGYSVVWPL